MGYKIKNVKKKGHNLDNVKVLQCGFQKSGNSLLNKILVLCLKELGLYRTFMIRSGFAKFFEQLYRKYGIRELFNGYLEVDDLTVDENNEFILFHPFPYKELKKIYVETDLLLSTTSLVWSHLKIDLLNPIFLNFGLRFYIIRDGRDVINSLIHFTTQENMRKLDPAYKIDNPHDLYDRYDIFSRYVALWKEHIESYFCYKEFFIEIRFEKLKNCGEDFLKILKIFGLEHKKKDLCKKISFKKMKESSPLHLRKGTIGDWKNYFSSKHKEIFKEIAGDILIQLGYEENNDW